jgi:hypothetical protein
MVRVFCARRRISALVGAVALVRDFIHLLTNLQPPPGLPSPQSDAMQQTTRGRLQWWRQTKGFVDAQVTGGGR